MMFYKIKVDLWIKIFSTYFLINMFLKIFFSIFHIYNYFLERILENNLKQLLFLENTFNFLVLRIKNYFYIF